jgi:hypothetical protein
MWKHGWPCAVAYLLVHKNHANIRANLWNLLPLTIRQGWKQLAVNVSLNIDAPAVFTDVTAGIARYHELTTSGVIADFITAMTDYSFPSVKCPAGCFAYVDECQSLSFKHFLAWKFGIHLFNANAMEMKGARQDWPAVAVQLDTFTVSPSVAVTDEGLSLLLCKHHVKRLTKSIIHVPINPVLGDMGFQLPDTTAAAVLTPNVIRAGRMGKWTNSSHVINAIGGYTGISSSSIAPKMDVPILNMRLATAEFLSATNRMDVCSTQYQRYAILPNGEQQWNEDLMTYKRFLRPSDGKRTQCLSGATAVYSHEAFTAHHRLFNRDCHDGSHDANNQAQIASKSLTHRMYIGRIELPLSTISVVD